MEERLLVQGLGRVTCRQEKRLLPPGVGVVVAGRIQASPAAVAAANPGSGGFVPGGGGFDPEETGTWEPHLVTWRAACDSCKNRVSFWAMAVFGLFFGPGHIPSVSRTCPAVSLGFFLFLIENQGILGDTRIQPYPAVSTRPIGNSCRVRAF